MNSAGVIQPSFFSGTCHCYKSQYMRFRLPQSFVILEMIAVIHFLFSGCPRILHWGVVKAAPTRTCSDIPRRVSFLSEGTTGILDAPVTVQQRFCVRIFLKRLLEGVSTRDVLLRRLRRRTQRYSFRTDPAQIRGTPYCQSHIEFCYVSHPFSFCRPEEKSCSKYFPRRIPPGSSSDTAAFSSCIQTAGQAHA